jgi:hypothetical protein
MAGLPKTGAIGMIPKPNNRVELFSALEMLAPF